MHVKAGYIVVNAYLEQAWKFVLKPCYCQIIF